MEAKIGHMTNSLFTASWTKYYGEINGTGLLLLLIFSK